MSPKKKIREDFIRNTKGIVSHIDNLAFVAAERAYSDADEWRAQLIQYLQANKNLLLERVNKVCLLYTSPSPRDRTRSRMPSSA